MSAQVPFHGLVWKVTTTLAAGNFILRANGARALYFFDTGGEFCRKQERDWVIVPDALAGTLIITLDLKSGNYSYST